MMGERARGKLPSGDFAKYQDGRIVRNAFILKDACVAEVEKPVLAHKTGTPVRSGI